MTGAPTLFPDDNDGGKPDKTWPVGERRRGSVRRDHPDTAHESADLKRKNIDKEKQFVREYLEGRGWHGAADFETITAGVAAGWTENGIRPRRIDLVNDGIVVDSGRKRHNPKTDRNVIVWVIKRFA